MDAVIVTAMAIVIDSAMANVIATAAMAMAMYIYG